MKLALVVFDDVQALEVVGPLEFFAEATPIRICPKNNDTNCA
jgi:hypothetical protein